MIYRGYMSKIELAIEKSTGDKRKELVEFRSFLHENKDDEKIMNLLENHYNITNDKTVESLMEWVDTGIKLDKIVN